MELKQKEILEPVYNNGPKPIILQEWKLDKKLSGTPKAYST